MSAAPLPKSLLSFLYNVMYNEDVKKDFHVNQQDVVVNQFGLSTDVLDLVVQLGKEETGTSSGNPDAWNELLKLLGTELHDNRNTFW